MTDRDLLLKFIGLIEPIHKFHVQAKRFLFASSDVHYEIPGSYVAKFSTLYEELVKHIGTPGEADKLGTTTPLSLPEGTPPPPAPQEST